MAAVAEHMALDGDMNKDDKTALKQQYLDALAYVERLHRLLLDVIKDELDRLGRGDINSVQALLLFNIGESELTAGELKTRGYYQGSNVSYNLKKLVESGYIHHQRSEIDRRSVRVSLTERGKEVSRIVDALYERHVGDMLTKQIADAGQMSRLNDMFRDMERFWSDQIRYRY
ncbi:winged helix DNA-binding protein [Hyphomicrobiales bacterium FT118]|uniref:Winged helix DNA-binding protein n=2 Tax=Futiania mangrovi TaxID=2959716 RepID=A0A9J6PAJ6_9PROT|nr:winged helix DNA-binding protein [Futiania mangrovii]